MANSRQLLTAVEAAEVLQCSRRTILRMVESGDLPYVRKLEGPNGAYLFDAGVVGVIARQSGREEAKSA